MTAARPPLLSSSAARRRCDARWGGAFLGLAQRAIRCGGGRGAPRGPGRGDQADGENPKASEPGLWSGARRARPARGPRPRPARPGRVWSRSSPPWCAAPDVDEVSQRGGEHGEVGGDRQARAGCHPAHGAGEQGRHEQDGRAAEDGAEVCPLPMRIVLSYLTHWAQRSSSASCGPAAWRQPTTVRGAGAVTSMYRPGRRDVPRDLLVPGLLVSGPAPSRYSQRGPGGRLPNVSAAGVSQCSQPPCRFFTLGSEPVLMG
jgi:hypothetical protein